MSKKPFYILLVIGLLLAACADETPSPTTQQDSLDPTSTTAPPTPTAAEAAAVLTSTPTPQADTEAPDTDVDQAQAKPKKDKPDKAQDDDDDDDDDPPGQSPWCQEGTTRQHPALAKLANSTDTPYEEVAGWFCAGYGVGEIKNAYSYAEQSGVPVDEIFAMRELGLGWGEVKQELGIQPGNSQNDDDDDDDDEAASASLWCEDTTQQHPALAKLADTFDTPYEELLGWYCAGHGVGAIKLAYTYAERSGISVEEIFAMRESGLGWGQIKQQLGL